MRPTPLITIPLPTINSRAHWLGKAIKAYKAYADVEILIFDDVPSCGLGWQAGAEKAKGDYIHFGADDVEMRPGWAEAAIDTCDRGFLPAPLIYHTDGSLQACGGSWERMEPNGAITDFTRGPFVSREQWEQLSPLVSPFLLMGPHYYTDNIFTWAGIKLGIDTVNCHNYQYTHHGAMEGRNETRIAEDGNLYSRYISGELTP